MDVLRRFAALMVCDGHRLPGLAPAALGLFPTIRFPPAVDHFCPDVDGENGALLPRLALWLCARHAGLRGRRVFSHVAPAPPVGRTMPGDPGSSYMI